MIANVVRTKIVATFLGPSGLALINIYNTVLKFVNNSTNLGISFSAVKHISELFEENDREKLRYNVCTIRTWCLITGIFGMLLCLLFSPLISWWMFKNDSYTVSMMLISPCVLFMAIMGGEIAILKSMRKLKKVAVASVLCALSALFISAPLYYFFHTDGIIASLLLTNLAMMLIYMHYANQEFPIELALKSKSHILAGMPMVRLGIAYLLAGVFGQGAELVIRKLLMKFGEGDEVARLGNVGLYNSGYALAVSLASIVFIAIEADYFPRLSAVCSNKKRMSRTINQQIEVCVLLMSPLLIFFVLFMPLFLNVLYSNKFISAEPMAIAASFYMFFRSLTLPAAYLPLANGDSKMYLLTEFICDVFMALAIPYSFKLWGLTGAGFALSATGLLDMIIIHSFYRRAYKFEFSFRLFGFYLLQFLLLSISVAVCLRGAPLLKYTIGSLAFAVSLFVSLRILQRETEIIPKLKKRLAKTFHRNK